MNLPLFQGRRSLDEMVGSFKVCMFVSLAYPKKTSMLRHGASNTTNVWYQDRADISGFTPVQTDFAS
jgi:hypothetical protein